MIAISQKSLRIYSFAAQLLPANYYIPV